MGWGRGLRALLWTVGKLLVGGADLSGMGFRGGKPGGGGKEVVDDGVAVAMYGVGYDVGMYVCCISGCTRLGPCIFVKSLGGGFE